MPGAVNLLGLGIGPGLGGVLAEWSAHPTRLPFEVHLAVLIVAVVATQLAIRRLLPRRAVELGLAALVAGLGLLAASLAVASYPLFLAGALAYLRRR